MVRLFTSRRGTLSRLTGSGQARHFLSRGSVLAICCAVAGGWFAAPRGIAAPIDEKGPGQPPVPAATQPTTEPGSEVRGFDDVRADLDVQGRALKKVLPALDSLFDESKRAEVAPKALPLLKKM